MAQYIDKDAVAAELKRRISENKKDLEDARRTNFSLPASLKDYSEGYEDALVLFKEKFLDTLEVKEVDLEKEIDKYIDDNFYITETWGILSLKTKNELNQSNLEDIAKHFFELGTKAAQKGE